MMDDGGLERATTRSLFGAVCARIVGSALCEVGNVLHSVASGLGELSKAAWMIETHFGNRYEAATKINLAAVVGEPEYVYSGWADEDEDEPDEDEVESE